MPAIPTRAARACLSLVGALALAACAPRTAVPAADPLFAAAEPTVVAENGGGEWMDVYLVHERGEWYLGRLAPGAKSALRLPAAYRASPSGMVRLLVLSGAARSIQPSRDPRAIVSIAQPITSVLGQRWTLAQGQLVGRRERGW